MLQIGQQAPSFRVEGVVGEEVKEYSLEEYRGKWVVLFFYPLDFTFICPTEITAFSENKAKFDELDTVVFGASTDSVHSHKAWLKELGHLNFPLLSDNNHALTRSYGILLEDEGISLRGTYIIDPEGNLQYQLVHSNDVGRNIDEVLRVLSALQTGELCQVGWKPGEETLGAA